MHPQFEELCALAVTGQITREGKAMLEEHARCCDECREFLRDLGPLRDHLAPVVAGSRVRLVTPPEGMRERFFERAAAEGISIQAGPSFSNNFPEDDPKKTARPDEVRLSLQERASRWRPVVLRFAWPLAAAAVCIMLGYNLAQWRFGESHRYADNVVTVPQPPAPSLDHSAAAMFSNQERQKLESEKRLALISSALTQAQAEKLGMTQELATLARQAAANAESERQLEEERQKVQRTTSLVSSLQAELGAARKKQSDLDVILTAQKDAAMDANAKLAHLQAQFEHEGDMKLTKSQYEEIISARNLHIVDVYDVETNGRRQKSFGRIFYVEGRSLVFYAYDLPNSKHPNKNLAFHVWGEKAGTKATSFQLGIMHPDDPIQNRWVLTFDDPKVLNRITAVYITINPPAQPSPQGRQLMYAFLGNPNHP